MKNIFKNKEGYTLVEMIVSLAIISTLSGVIISNIGQFRRGGDVAMAAYLLASDIRVAQGHALSIRKHRNESDIKSPEGCWGIYVNSVVGDNRYILFGDFNPQDYNYSGGIEEENTIDLPNNISINRITLSGSGVVNNANVIFEAPKPNTIINIGGGVAQNFIQIELIDDTSLETKTVLVNKFGLVDVQN